MHLGVEPCKTNNRLEWLVEHLYKYVPTLDHVESLGSNESSLEREASMNF